MIYNGPVAPLEAVRRANGITGSIGPGTNKKPGEHVPGSVYLLWLAISNNSTMGKRIIHNNAIITTSRKSNQ